MDELQPLEESLPTIRVSEQMWNAVRSGDRTERVDVPATLRIQQVLGAAISFAREKPHRVVGSRLGTSGQITGLRDTSMVLGELQWSSRNFNDRQDISMSVGAFQ